MISVISVYLSITSIMNLVKKGGGANESAKQWDESPIRLCGLVRVRKGVELLAMEKFNAE